MSELLQDQIEIRMLDQSLWLRGDGTAYLPDYNALLVADLHLGKDASFRHAGIPVPGGMHDSILMQLENAVAATRVESLFLLGDMIHDRHSMTRQLTESVTQWRQRLRCCAVTLIRGNHDRHVRSFPAEWKLRVEQSLSLGRFDLVHEVPQADIDEPRQISIGGHWHPVTLVGKRADQMRLRCFVVRPHSVTLPAFGDFKGGLKQSRKPGLKLYPVCDGKIWAG